jgi:hypothetical protein
MLVKVGFHLSVLRKIKLQTEGRNAQGLPEKELR